MKHFLIILLTLLLYGCTRTVYVPKPVEHRVEKTIVERDTVVETRVEREEVIVTTKDTVAFAETKYAEAEASIKGNSLHLDLRNKDVKIPTRTKAIYVTQIDSIPYPVEVYIPQEVKHVPITAKILSIIGLLAIVAFAAKLLTNKII